MADEITWLHISDIHLKAGASYDRDVVLRSLLSSLKEFGKRDLSPDVIFITGDLAFSGVEDEYTVADQFLDDLLKATNLGRDRIFVVPGNHDVDRKSGIGLARTLDSEDHSVQYFSQNAALIHIEP
jgi:3',5'-cyclic AMP phosphodiesterase CpdA